MDIQRISDSSIKIKSKNSTFLIDHTGKSDSEVLVFTQAPADYSQLVSPLVIGGPGDYETAGVSIKGEKHGEKITYSFLEENQKLLVVPSSVLSDIKEFEDSSSILVIADQPLEDALSEIAADLVFVVSPDEFLPNDKSNIKKIDRVSLKKTEEYKGSIVHLSK